MKTRLDPNLLSKLSVKTGKSEKYLREQMSKKANKLGISSEAVLIILAEQAGIGTSRYQRSLLPHVQAEIRSVHAADKRYEKHIVIKKIAKETESIPSDGGLQRFIERVVSDTISKTVIGILKPFSS